MTVDEILSHLHTQNWLLSLHELANDWWVVTYHLRGTTVMSSHSSWGLLPTMTYNISKMELMVREHEHETAKKEAFLSGFSIPSGTPLQRRL